MKVEVVEQDREKIERALRTFKKECVKSVEVKVTLIIIKEENEE